MDVTQSQPFFFASWGSKASLQLFSQNKNLKDAHPSGEGRALSVHLIAAKTGKASPPVISASQRQEPDLHSVLQDR